MSYTRWKSDNPGKIRLKGKRFVKVTCYGDLVAGTHDERTWFVFNGYSLTVEAIYHSEPNVNGWIASEAHALSHIARAAPFSPFELDAIP